MNFFILLLGITLLILALARPHDDKDIEEYRKKNIEGIDIILAMDVSGSMLAEDFKPNLNWVITIITPNTKNPGFIMTNKP